MPHLPDPKLDAIRLHAEHYVFVGAPKLLRASPLARDEDARHHTLLEIAAQIREVPLR